MPVDNPNVVDAIGSLVDQNAVILTIADQLDWGDPNHLSALQSKLNRYLAFIESGEILEKYPFAMGKQLQIDVVCRYDPSPDGLAFLHTARETITNVGVALTWRVFAA